ncbi:pyruvate, phosphate dikinase [Anaplasma platys]|uniref:Pyruvate, phosphate dikinase n=1 Tax=Anaplasma platys TaxID=949 RepID=A0A858PXI3_9RICK|nr:pyruvate, phosphate dikinase [Anaplasma platys]QJC27289.1 pyruvate, phosphate dikinase [Anaplasma platys]
MDDRLIYHFGRSRCDGGAHLAHLLGGKGAGLAEMCNIGVSVPPGFTISTSACSLFQKTRQLPDKVLQGLPAALELLGNEVGLEFGNPDRPLLVSVRSGSVQSMPGMLDTILNVGLNDEVVDKLKSTQARFAYDSYRRLIKMYATSVLRLDEGVFEDVNSAKQKASGTAEPYDADPDAMAAMVEEYKRIILTRTGQEFPQDVNVQLHNSISAVFGSWTNSRAVSYRSVYGIPATIGTAVNVQSMVFGNISNNSATGVVFTRNPSTGDKEMFGEFLVNAQGEDIVSGQKDPVPIKVMADVMPEAYRELKEVCAKLEKHNRDMQDIEFTVQDGKLWILQTRDGKRSAQAAVCVAVAMVKEGLISAEDAIMRIDTRTLSGLLHPTLEKGNDNVIVGRGLPASPGAASGYVAFTSSDAEELKRQGKNAVLVRQETSPEDISGMISAVGVLTLRGGMTSHAAVVARGMGKPCICGANSLCIDESGQFFFNENNLKIKREDSITINGSTGEIILGAVQTVTPSLPETFHELMSWIDSTRTMGIWANADTVEDLAAAKLFGAEGVGLCRTEHMFFSDNRITTVREMILASDKQERVKALDRIGAMQRQDFKDMFKFTGGKQPLTIRLLDPPLHEFLPASPEVFEGIAKTMERSLDYVKHRVSTLLEKNPMLGHRGCRLAISYPEIYEMQARAIFEAAQELKDGEGLDIVPEIMIPFVMDEQEIVIVSNIIKDVALKFHGIQYRVGAMIELPRAALLADRLAKHVDFFSFGTNDLTQTTMGISRDDSSKFTEHYIDSGVFSSDPFEALDIDGVGRLITIAVDLVRKSGRNIKMGLCGEHGNTPQAMKLCSELGINYVSCSPYKVPVAKLLAAQRAIKNKSEA